MLPWTQRLRCTAPVTAPVLARLAAKESFQGIIYPNLPGIADPLARSPLPAARRADQGHCDWWHALRVGRGARKAGGARGTT